MTDNSYFNLMKQLFKYFTRHSTKVLFTNPCLWTNFV
jgi:hypothetical protein